MCLFVCVVKCCYGDGVVDFLIVKVECVVCLFFFEEWCYVVGYRIMVVILYVFGMIGCCLVFFSSMWCGLLGDRLSGGIWGKWELCFGIGRGRVKGMYVWVCKVNEDEDGGNEVVNFLDLEKEFWKVLDSEEFKVSGFWLVWVF